jgi:L-ribulose-5-phosphate 3-epimerase
MKVEPQGITNSNRNNDGILPMKRRLFLWKTGALVLGAGLGPRLTALTEAVQPGQVNATKLGWKTSVQHYTYRRFTLFEALEQTAAVGLRYFEVRSNLKLGPMWPGKNANESMPTDARQEFKMRLADLGLSVPSVFADFSGELDQAQRIFEIWKGFGTEVIVAEPPAGSYDMLEKLCEEFQMRLALHNHQKGQSDYWNPEIVLDVCANRGKRIGACADVGQWARSDLDPVECLRKLEGRIISFHLKDVLMKGDLHSRNTVMGEGQADCANTLKELKRQGFTGVITIDFEHDTPALQEDMARNIAFVEEHARKLLAPSGDPKHAGR